VSRPSKQQAYVLHRMQQGATLTCLLNTAWAHSADHTRATAGNLHHKGNDEWVSPSTVMALLRQGTIIEVSREPRIQAIWNATYTLAQQSLEKP